MGRDEKEGSSPKKLIVRNLNSRSFRNIWRTKAGYILHSPNYQPRDRATDRLGDAHGNNQEAIYRQQRLILQVSHCFHKKPVLQ